MKFVWVLGPPRGDCFCAFLSALEGHEIGEVPVSSMSIGVISMKARLTSILARGSSSRSSIGEFEYDWPPSAGRLGGVLASPEPLRMKLLPRSYCLAFSFSILVCA